MEKVRCFLTHMKWQQQQRERGGITWLELYILSILHGGKVQTDPGPSSQARTVSLQSAIKNFKRRTRNVAMHCVKKEDEWNFHTCEARRSRLEAIAISNNLEARRNVCSGTVLQRLKNAGGGHTWIKCVRPPPRRTHLVRWGPPIFAFFWPI